MPGASNFPAHTVINTLATKYHIIISYQNNRKIKIQKMGKQTWRRPHARVFQAHGLMQGAPTVGAGLGFKKAKKYISRQTKLRVPVHVSTMVDL